MQGNYGYINNCKLIKRKDHLIMYVHNYYLLILVRNHTLNIRT